MGLEEGLVVIDLFSIRYLIYCVQLSLIPEELRTILRVRVYAWRCLRGDFRDRQVQQEELRKPININQPLGPIHTAQLPGYEQKSQSLCQHHGDSMIIFSSEARKLNRSGKLDRFVDELTVCCLWRCCVMISASVWLICISLHAFLRLHCLYLSNMPDVTDSLFVHTRKNTCGTHERLWCWKRL